MVNSMVSKHTLALTLVLSSTLPVVGITQPTDAHPTPVTVGDLDAIMQQEILLKAMADRAKQQAALDQYGNAGQNTRTLSNQPPRLAWRRASASGWLAKFILADGSSIIAGEGETLPGGYVVAQISGQQVELKQDGHLIQLSGSATPARPTAKSTDPTPNP